MTKTQNLISRLARSLHETTARLHLDYTIRTGDPALLHGCRVPHCQARQKLVREAKAYLKGSKKK